MTSDHNTTYVDVILPLAINNFFTYSVSAQLAQHVLPGSRVIVSFGKRKVYSAIVKRVHAHKPETFQTKEILAVIDEKPLVKPIQLQFWDWVAEYYMCFVGDVYKAAVPSGLKLESETKIVANSEFNDQENLLGDELLIYQIVRQKKSVSIEELEAIANIKNTVAIVYALIGKEAVFINEIIRAKFKPKMESFIEAGGDISDADFVNGAFEILSKAKKQQELFLLFLQACKTNTISQQKISRKTLLSFHGAGQASLQGLLEKGILVETEIETGRLNKSAVNIKAIKELNLHQAEAFNAITTLFLEKDVVLLHGVTASGKTELYIKLIQQTIAKGKQVLYLLPEIALTAQIINRLKSVFGNKVGIYHSKFNDSERVEVWNNILQSEKDDSYKIILGVRSSIFLPFDNLGLIIVDEEHETSYKQFDPSPRYNARDAAVMLAKMHQAKVLMGTATPAVETYFNAQSGKYGLVTLFERYTKVELPIITIVDIKDETHKKRMHSIFSKTLLEKMSIALSKNEQVILFQNRRGFSPYIECQVCATIPLCKYCDVTLTYHKFSNSLVCHYCGYSQANTSLCEACKSPNMTTKGFGTEKIEDEIQLFFPDKKVERMDLDSTRAKNAYSEIINRFEERQIDILVGTQMVTKGLDFENVSLVGVLNADTMLNQPDFRAFERSFQMMTQVAGRAGRSKNRGEVVIQTSNPLHQIIADVKNNNYESMLTQQLLERQKFGYPPFTRLIRLTVRHKKMDILEKSAQVLAQMLKKTMNKSVLGPEFPPVGKVQDYYLKNILLKIHQIQHLAQARQNIIQSVNLLHTNDEFKSVDVIVNVDPY